MGLPTIYFNMFEYEGEPGSFKAARATGTFEVVGQETTLTVQVPEQRGKESGPDAYRRVVEKVRDTLTDILNNPGGVRM
jgi:hypothetical protein